MNKIKYLKQNLDHNEKNEPNNIAIALGQANFSNIWNI